MIMNIENKMYDSFVNSLSARTPIGDSTLYSIKYMSMYSDMYASIRFSPSITSDINVMEYSMLSSIRNSFSGVPGDLNSNCLNT